jgi:uncharacterized protein (DUF58 family)
MTYPVRSSWGIFIIWALALAFALGTGRRLAFNLLYFITGVIVIAIFWTLANVRGLSLKRVTRSQRSQVGKYFEETVEIANRSRWPKLWVEVQDFSTLPGHQAGKVVNGLGRKTTVGWQVRTLCQQRGRYILGPLLYTTGDPLGIFRVSRQVPGVTSLVVTPAVYTIPEFSPPSGYLPGSETTRRRTPYITASVSGVRDYAPGDGFNRIHWPSTARTGRLISKEFELDPLADLWIFLDMHEEAQAASPWTPVAEEALPWVLRPRALADRIELPPSTEEYGVAITASLAQHFLQLDREVGFLSYANRREVIQPDRGERQLSRLLEILAVIQARGHIPLAQVLATEGAHLARHTTLIVVTPSADSRWVAALRGLRARGVQGVGVLLAARTFGLAPDWQPVQAELYASGLPSYLVSRGDDLAVALSTIPQGRSLRRYAA